MGKYPLQNAIKNTSVRNIYTAIDWRQFASYNGAQIPFFPLRDMVFHVNNPLTYIKKLCKLK